jgi:hypothetical protein
VIDLRFDAWSRLLATFRAVHGGVEHDLLSLVPYGGHLFDPDRFPFLEGRPKGTRWREAAAQPLPVSNRTVLHLLEALQYLTVRVSGGGPPERRRLSFRELDIEQIGHVYEGLLDHTARRAGEVVLGLAGTREKQSEASLSQLEQLRARGGDALLEFLRSATGRQAATLSRALEPPADLDEPRFRAACGNDDALWQRVRPFAALVRRNDVGYPVVVLPGSVYVTEGTDRRTSGTQYTPRTITEPVVRYALEPLVYEGPAEGAPQPWKLRSARELLALKICDMACGSGAFLVAACRYQADRLVEAWALAEEANPGVTILPEGEPATGDPAEVPLPRDAEERRVFARRLIAQRCLYGVDKNQQAVEMAKLSLWLLTLDKDRPFTFLDHAIKCGDSLLGVTTRQQVEAFDFVVRESEDKQISFWRNAAAALFRTATDRRKRLEASPVMTPADVDRKEMLLREAEEVTTSLRLMCDLLAGAAIATANGRPPEANEGFDRRRVALWRSLHETYRWDESVDSGRAALEALRPEARRLLDSGLPAAASARRPFHWAIEFPEILVDGDGFDAVIGNPPFMGGQKITGALGTPYRDYLVGYIANGQRGSADICAYFFLRAWGLLRRTGQCALLATNTIAQGDTREVGLDRLATQGAVIPRAVASRKWPGQANLEVAEVWLRKGDWAGPFVLEDKVVPGITAQLTPPGEVTGKPFRLKANEGRSFQGSIVLGLGFTMTPEEAELLRAKDPRNADVLFPYLTRQSRNQTGRLYYDA